MSQGGQSASRSSRPKYGFAPGTSAGRTCQMYLLVLTGGPMRNEHVAQRIKLDTHSVHTAQSHPSSLLLCSVAFAFSFSAFILSRTLGALPNFFPLPVKPKFSLFL